MRIGGERELTQLSPYSATALNRSLRAPAWNPSPGPNRRQCLSYHSSRATFTLLPLATACPPRPSSHRRRPPPTSRPASEVCRAVRSATRGKLPSARKKRTSGLPREMKKQGARGRACAHLRDARGRRRNLRAPSRPSFPSAIGSSEVSPTRSQEMVGILRLPNRSASTFHQPPPATAQG